MNHPDINGYSVPEEFRKRICNVCAERCSLHCNFLKEKATPINEVLEHLDKAIFMKECIFQQQPQHLYLSKALLLLESKDYMRALQFFRRSYLGLLFNKGL